MALNMRTPRPVAVSRGKNQPQKSPEELAQTLAEVEKSRLEEAKQRVQDEKQRKKELAAAKQLVSKEVRSATQAVSKMTTEVSKMETQKDRVEKQKEALKNVKNRQASMCDDKLMRFDGQRNDFESAIRLKTKKLGEARGRLEHAKFAAEMLEKGIIVAIDPEGRRAIEDQEDRMAIENDPHGAQRRSFEDGSLQQDAKLNDEVVTLRNERDELERANQQLRSDLGDMELRLRTSDLRQQGGAAIEHDQTVTNLIEQNEYLVRENQELMKRVEKLNDAALLPPVQNVGPEGLGRKSVDSNVNDGLSNRVDPAEYPDSTVFQTESRDLQASMPISARDGTTMTSLTLPSPRGELHSVSDGTTPREHRIADVSLRPISSVTDGIKRETASADVTVPPVSGSGKPPWHGHSHNFSALETPPKFGAMQPTGVYGPGVRSAIAQPVPFPTLGKDAHGGVSMTPPRVLASANANLQQYQHRHTVTPPTFVPPQGLQQVFPSSPRDVSSSPISHGAPQRLSSCGREPTVTGAYFSSAAAIAPASIFTSTPSTPRDVPRSPVNYGAPPRFSSCSQRPSVTGAYFSSIPAFAPAPPFVSPPAVPSSPCYPPRPAAVASAPPVMPVMSAAVEAGGCTPVHQPRLAVEPAAASSCCSARRGSMTDELFDRLDADHDGVVTRQEFRAGIKKHIVHGGDR